MLGAAFSLADLLLSYTIPAYCPKFHVFIFMPGICQTFNSFVKHILFLAHLYIGGQLNGCIDFLN